MAHFLVPLFFCIFGYLLIYVALQPVISPIISLCKMVLLEQALDPQETPETLFDMNNLPKEDLQTIPVSQITLPSIGMQYGKLRIERIALEAPLYYGDSTKELKNGVGQYVGSMFPGFNSTVLIAGHNHTYFKKTKNVIVGDRVEIQTNYGKYVYEITDIQIKNATDTSHFDLGADYENLVLYTCYPFNSIGATPTRYFLYGKYISGPKILMEE